MIGFKSDREKQEFSELETKNLALFRLIHCLSEFCELELKKDLVITSVFRTAEEQAALYASVPLEKKVLKSPHMIWQAVDLRSTFYKDDEIKRMLAFLNTFRYVQGRPVAIYHVIAGNAFHFHCQFVGHDE